VTGKLIVRFSSVLNKSGADDSSITVDLLAFATYWIGAGVAIGVLAWSVSERRWLPAGAMLLFALVAIFMAYREIRPSKRRAEPSAANRPAELQAAAQPSPVPQQQPHHQPQDHQRPQHQQPQHQQRPARQQQPQHQQLRQQEQQYQQQHAVAPARQAYPTTTQPAAVPSPHPQHPQPSYNAKSTNGQAPPDNTQNGWNRRGQDWR
jgi:type IV secretory pathway VirB10-like protein